MKKSLVKYLVTGTSDLSFGEMIQNYDPLLLKEISLVLSSMLGGTCTIQVEEVELLAAEETEV